jgi:hypothetical protein
MNGEELSRFITMLEEQMDIPGKQELLKSLNSISKTKQR